MGTSSPLADRRTARVALLGLLVLAIVMPALAPLPQSALPAVDLDALRGTHGGDHVRWRPDTDAAGEDAFTAPLAARFTRDTEHFRIHWTDQTEDAATPEFVDQTAAVFEEVWEVQIEQLGWPAPPPDNGAGGNDLIDVYLVDLGIGAYGYASPDIEALCGGCPDPHGYLVLDNDYAGFDPSPRGALQATASHEFGHLVQFGLAFEGEAWAYEATSVWLEQQVYPDVDARSQYLVDFARHPHLPITDFGEDGGFDRAYGAYVWNLWLSDRYGPDIIRRAWLASTESSDHLLEGYDAALRDVGSNFVKEYLAFAGATAGWEVGGFPTEPGAYPRVERTDLLTSGDVTEITLDHTGMYLADIAVPSGASTVTVTIHTDRFISGGVALVAAAGSTVLSTSDGTLFDGIGTVTLDGVAGLDRVTLILVNADTTLAVPKPPRSDSPRYFFTHVPYRIGVDVDPGPLEKR
ncbi:MXAN_6640 family putative metalloprotease [Euzebya tangerina]|uniref:MXAN_6640 family putative metalloprotease n=1 Tax=Euzebya tangerina TaxID=591198 RepID=UPI0013C302D7|nr:MXAN_6640 family putative metalloprotease [Euzebya tangerina]